MDLQTAILAVVTIALSLSPFFLSWVFSQRKAKAVLAKLQEVARSVGSTIQEHETCGNFTIGVDASKKMLFFMKKGDELSSSKTINLTKVLQCKKIHEGRTVKDGGSQYTVVDRLGLHFIFRDPTVLDIQIEFFNMKTDIKPSGELQCMDKWHNTILGLIG
jgi:hypothetical protein